MVSAAIPARPDGPLVGIQYLRGAAATLVVLEHLLLRLVRRGSITLDETLAPGMGYVGVATFFAISGFIMVHTTYRRFGEPGAGGQFMWRRVARILPLYYSTTVAIVAFLFLTQSLATGGGYEIPSVADWLRSAFFIPYFNEGLLQPVYTLGWTLQFEMLFYLLFAICLAFRPSVGIPLILTSVCILAALGVFIPDTAPGAPWWAIFADFYTKPILLYFVGGMLLALLLRRTGPGLLPLGLKASCVVATAFLIGSISTPAIWAPVWICGALFVVSLARTPSRPGLFSRASTLFGDVSYSLYLTHSFILGILALIVSKFLSGWAAFAAGGVVGTIMCFIAAWFVWRFAEKPVTEFLTKKR